MEQNFAASFEDIRHERSFILLLSLTDPDILKQSEFTDDERKIMKNLALEKLHRQRNLKEHVAIDLLEKHFSDEEKTTYPNTNNETELLKKTKDDETKNLKYQTKNTLMEI